MLERELFNDNLPPAIYHTLVEEVNKGLPTLHRYFGLRQRMLGLDELNYYDLYTPLVSLEKLAAGLGLSALWIKDESKRLELEAFKVLGAAWALTRLLARVADFRLSDEPLRWRTEPMVLRGVHALNLQVSWHG